MTDPTRAAAEAACGCRHKDHPVRPCYRCDRIETALRDEGKRVAKEIHATADELILAEMGELPDRLKAEGAREAFQEAIDTWQTCFIHVDDFLPWLRERAEGER